MTVLQNRIYYNYWCITKVINKHQILNHLVQRQWIMLKRCSPVFPTAIHTCFKKQKKKKRRTILTGGLYSWRSCYVSLKWRRSSYLLCEPEHFFRMCLFPGVFICWVDIAMTLPPSIMRINCIIWNHITRSSPNASALNGYVAVVPGWNAHRVLVKGQCPSAIIPECWVQLGWTLWYFKKSIK